MSFRECFWRKSIRYHAAQYPALMLRKNSLDFDFRQRAARGQWKYLRDRNNVQMKMFSFFLSLHWNFVGIEWSTKRAFPEKCWFNQNKKYFWKRLSRSRVEKLFQDYLLSVPIQKEHKSSFNVCSRERIFPLKCCMANAKKLKLRFQK